LLLNAIPPYYNLRVTKHAASQQCSEILFAALRADLRWWI